MRPVTLCALLATSTFTVNVLAAEPRDIAVLEKVRQHITPLTHPLDDRLPILTWQSRGFPTGLEDGRVGEVQQLLMDR